jgi:hypothetical protein
MKVIIPITDDLRTHCFSKTIRREIDKEIIYGLGKVPEHYDLLDRWAWLSDEQESWLLEHHVQVDITEGNEQICLNFQNDLEAMEFCLKFL